MRVERASPFGDERWIGKAVRRLVCNRHFACTTAPRKRAYWFLTPFPHLELNILGESLFEKAWILKGGNGVAPQAFAYGEQLFVRRGASNLLSEVVHEGTHGLDYLKGFPGSVEQLEKRAYFFERQFQRAGGGEVEFRTIEEMVEFIRQNY